jgi:CCR4-NOT complex subunit CAF16
LLIGANGAGKSTILRILGGRHLIKPDESVRILGKSCFYDTSLNFERAYLDTDWGMRTVAFAGAHAHSLGIMMRNSRSRYARMAGYGVPLQADIPVFGMMTRLQEAHPARRQELIELLGIDVNWRMHRVSDGQRRRVQIFLGLIRPFKILLLDEVTVSLGSQQASSDTRLLTLQTGLADVVVRQDLLRWLKRESEERGATVLYATHIFDGLDDWPTHLHYLHHTGVTGWQGRTQDLDIYKQLREV